MNETLSPEMVTTLRQVADFGAKWSVGYYTPRCEKGNLDLPASVLCKAVELGYLTATLTLVTTLKPEIVYVLTELGDRALLHSYSYSYMAGQV